MLSTARPSGFPPGAKLHAPVPITGRSGCQRYRGAAEVWISSRIGYRRGLLKSDRYIAGARCTNTIADRPG